MGHSTFLEYFHTRMILMEAHCSATVINVKQQRKEMVDEYEVRIFKGNIMSSK